MTPDAAAPRTAWGLETRPFNNEDFRMELNSELRTFIIDLRQELAALASTIEKNVRNEMRKAVEGNFQQPKKDELEVMDLPKDGISNGVSAALPTKTHTAVHSIGGGDDDDCTTPAEPPMQAFPPGMLVDLNLNQKEPNGMGDGASISQSVTSSRVSRARIADKSSSRIITSHRNRVGHSKNTFEATMDPDASMMERLHIQATWLVSHNTFDVVVAAAIILNGIVVGIQTDYSARHTTDKPPVVFQAIEYIFCVVFTIELALRLFAYRLRFFTMKGLSWNIFDLTVVTLQLFEIFMTIAAEGIGLSFNLMRVLRLIRVIRLARTLRLIGELRTIVSSIASSMKPLFWTGILLFMIVYVLGVYVTQVVLHERIRRKDRNQTVPDALEKYWGSLVPSIFSLFQSITGGVDWDQVARPLIDHIGPETGILFSLYIMFTMFAMLNVVTGVFIESVMSNASHENEMRTMYHVQNLFKSMDVNRNASITWEEFADQLETNTMREFFKTIDVNIDHAHQLFELLDIDGSGEVDADEFMDGCLRIWSPKKFGPDLRMLVRDVKEIARTLEGMKTGEKPQRVSVAQFMGPSRIARSFSASDE